ERPIEIGVHESRGDRVDRAHNEEDVGRDAGQKGDNVDKHRAEQKIDRMETGGRDPFDVFRGVMYRVIAPQRLSVKDAVYPVETELASNKIDRELNPERQPGENAVPILEEFHQAVRGVYPEQINRDQNCDADAAEAVDERN